MLIARRVSAALTLLHVIDADQPERLISSEREDASSLLADATRTLNTDDEIPAEPLVMVGDVDAAIIEAAEDVDADLIIMGPHRKRARDVFTGTVVERVLRRAQRPFLIAANRQLRPIAKRCSLLMMTTRPGRRAGRRSPWAFSIT